MVVENGEEEEKSEGMFELVKKKRKWIFGCCECCLC
jgi:hypothetical protein